jgi:hypothetical protein
MARYTYGIPTTGGGLSTIGLFNSVAAVKKYAASWGAQKITLYRVTKVGTVNLTAKPKARKVK